MSEPAATDVFALPEFTRALTGFASVTSLGHPAHERIFGPLLAARAAAARVTTIDGQLAAFDAARLRQTLEETLAALAAERFRRDGAERRAFVAQLEELATPAFEACDRLRRDADALRATLGVPAHSVSVSRERWHTWVEAVQGVFNGVDRFWSAVQGRVSRTVARLFVLAMLGAALWAPRLHAQSGQHVTVRVEGVRPESLLTRGFDVVGVERGTALVVVDPAQRARLEGAGWRVTSVATSGVRANAGAARQVVPAPTVYRSYDDPTRGIRAFIDSLAANNPRVSVDTIGFSYEHRPMLAVKVGPRGDSPARPNVLFMATYHAREWAATEMALRLLVYLANPPAGNTRVDSLLQSRDIWIVPVANPDGYQYTFTGDRLWRKTRSPQAGGAIGVDMNRNHREHWGLDEAGSSSDPSSEVYRGPSAASEIEIRNIEAFHVAHPPVVAVSYHTYAGLLLYPPSAVYGTLAADLPVYRTLAGSNLRSAVTDRLPGSPRTFYSPGSDWTLYVTNGDYTEWAGARYGTIAFTPEISSGYANSSYYGFAFPDDEAQLRQLFADNLPFALDVIESARDPLGYVSPTTFASSGTVTLESMSPEISATVPAALAATATISAPAPLTFRVDSTSGGRYTRRLVSAAVNRPPDITITVGTRTQRFHLLHANGAERDETGWTATQFTRDSVRHVAGSYSWASDGFGELRSPVIAVPADADTVSLLFWTRYDGSGFTELLHGDVSVSLDAGVSWQPVLRLQSFAPTFYPERVTVGGVKGKSIAFRFVANGLAWGLDEIAVVAHGAVTTVTPPVAAAFRPSENPVRRSVVHFTWPFGSATGEVQAYDFSGHRIWQSVVQDATSTGGSAPTVAWDLNAGQVANGVYVVVARSGRQTMRLKLYVVRGGT